LSASNPRYFNAYSDHRSRYPFDDEDEDEDDGHDDSELFDWDEEKTLVEALMNNG
jgi:hypothetical protein